MPNSSLHSKLHSVFHRDSKTSDVKGEECSSRTQSVGSDARSSKWKMQVPEVAMEPYNGDQCFGSCCRGKGYAR